VAQAVSPAFPDFCDFCHRLLDFLIPFNERHLKTVLKIKTVLKTWIVHFNHTRPHMSLGPGIPAGSGLPTPESGHRHRIPAGPAVRRAAILGGLHHEYWLGQVAA
jgi:hypothetical protein